MKGGYNTFAARTYTSGDGFFNPRQTVTQVIFDLRPDAPPGLRTEYNFKPDDLPVSEFADVETAKGAVEVILGNDLDVFSYHDLHRLKDYLEIVHPFDEVVRLSEKLIDLYCQAVDAQSDLEWWQDEVEGKTTSIMAKVRLIEAFASAAGAKVKEEETR
jgi:hypothetical protein